MLLLNQACPHKADREGYVDALFARMAEGVVEGPSNDLDEFRIGGFPRRELTAVRCVGLRVFALARAACIDPDLRQFAALALSALRSEKLREHERFDVPSIPRPR